MKKIGAPFGMTVPPISMSARADRVKKKYQVDRGIMTGEEYQLRIAQDLLRRHGSIRAVVMQHL
jgi:hypothetical protein